MLPLAPRFIRRSNSEPHLDRHQLKDLYLEGELKKAAVGYGKNEIRLDSRRLRVGSPVFHERKLEHLGVTVRVCGYQPQGCPLHQGDTPSPKNSTISWIHTQRHSIWDRLGPRGCCPNVLQDHKAAKQDHPTCQVQTLPGAISQVLPLPGSVEGPPLFLAARAHAQIAHGSRVIPAGSAAPDENFRQRY